MNNRYSNSQVAGIIIAVSSLMSVVLMAHHPTAAAHEVSAQVVEIAGESRLNGVVHGSLVVFLILNLFAFTLYSIGRGLHKLAVLMALCAYVISTFLMIFAALVNGVIYPGFLQEAMHHDPSLLEYTPLLRIFSWNINQTLANTSVASSSCAMILWSLNLIRSSLPQKLVGLIGILIGLVAVILVLGGWQKLDLTGMTSVIFMQVVWYLGVAYLLLRET